MKAHTLFGAAAVATLASAAAAEITIEFENFIAAGANAFPTSENALTGEVTGAFGDFILNADGENFTWADDLMVLIANEDFSDILVQMGGYSDFGAAYRGTWEFGASGDAGTAAGGTIDRGASVDVSGYTMYLGNGYAGGGNGDWSGLITVNGSVDYVPAPGALALLGIAGLAGRRRRA